MSRGASTTASSTSKSTATALARSSASPRDGAMQTAIASPTYRTLSVASGGQGGALVPVACEVIRIGLMRGRSAAVKTRPRIAGGTDIDRIRGWACGLRTKATSIVPANLMSGTNWPRPWRCLSSSLRNKDAPTPYWSLGMRRLSADLLRGLGDRGDDVGIAGAAADVPGEAVADLVLRAGTPAHDQVACGDQHRRRAVPALQRVALMKSLAQCRDDRIAGKAFDGLDLAIVAGDREHQAGARRLTVDKDRAGAAHAVLAAEMGPGQIAPFAQKVGQRQARRHVIGNLAAVDADADRGHASTCWTARVAA